MLTVLWRRRRILGAAVAAGVVAAGVIAGISVASAGSAHSVRNLDAAERRILRIAMTAAARAGDPRPLLIQHSGGSRAAANRVGSGEGVQGEARSYLVAERGRFVLKDVGPGGVTIRGSVITLVVDTSTGQVTDFGLGNSYPDLAALGPVSTDWSLAP